MQPEAPVQSEVVSSQEYTYENVQASVEDEKTPGFTIAGLCLGIASILFFCIPCCGVIISILGVVFSILGMNKSKTGKGMAIAGLICSGVGIVAALAMFGISLVSQMGNLG